jgi:putative ABC transport system permease protein
MSFLEAFRMALTALGSNKLRSALTLLGMVIGVFAILVSVTGVKVIDAYFQDRLNFLGASTFTISRTPAIQIGGSDRIGYRAPITYEQIERLERALEAPVALSVLEDFNFPPAALRYQDRETEPNLQILGTDEHFLENFSYELDQGRFFTEQDIHYGRPFLVLGSELAEELFPNETPLGKAVLFDGRRYQVIGVLASKGGFLGFSQDRRMLAPISYLFGVYGGAQRNIASISVRPLGTMAGAEVRDEVIARMRVIRKVPPGEENDFEVETNDTFSGIFDAFTGTLTIGGAAIGIIVLICSGIGIMNIMLVSVTERTREIGIRKALGARRRDVVRQFLLEAFVLCQIGGVIGIILGVLVGNLVAVQFDINFAVPWNWAVGAVFMVTAIALIFGVYPAYKAARLHPIEALRFE